MGFLFLQPSQNIFTSTPDAQKPLNSHDQIFSAKEIKTSGSLLCPSGQMLLCL